MCDFLLQLAVNLPQKAISNFVSHVLENEIWIILV